MRRASALRSHGLLGRLLRLQFRQEALDGATLTRLVLERLTDDATGQRGRDRADLSAQRRDGLGPLRLDLGPGVRDDPLGLLVRLLTHLGNDDRALLTGV